MADHVFISHSSHDDETVKAIRDALLASGVAVWDDARKLVAGDKLAPAIIGALNESRSMIAVLSPRTINSKWVTKEIKYALDLEKQRGPDKYKVIPVMVDGIELAALDHWFPEEPVGIKLTVGPGGLQNVLPSLFDALGLSLPIDAGGPTKVEALPIAELTLELSDPYIDCLDGKPHAAATAELTYKPAEPGTRDVRSKRFKLVAPLGPIEAEDLHWYLERYVSWPSGVFQERAKGVEARLPEWGRMLHKAVFEHEPAREAYDAWKRCASRDARRLTILVDRDLVAAGSRIGASDEEEKKRQADADEAASLLLGLPWELLRDDDGYWFLGPYPVRVRRGLPNRKEKPTLVTAAPLRVLLVSPRPEDELAAYIDHRVSARPVVEALASLGDLAELKLLRPPTFAALTKELDEAQRKGEPYHVVHFDGHGVYSHQTGLGALCFEIGEDSRMIENRRSDIIDAAQLAEVMRHQRVPLFFLDACQSAVSEQDPTASVAGTLLQGGVASVVAMSHSVLVETARRFVTEFYKELLKGRRIGEAMVEGQRELKANSFRYSTFRGELHLEDWFVPVLYQEEDDPQLIRELPAERVREALEEQRTLSLGELPEAPKHGFVGRSRELLKAERLLEQERYVVLRGEGGEGKTTLAAELARWLVETRRYKRVVFASLESHGEAGPLLFALGDQLVVNFGSVAGQGDGRGWLEVERALRERPTVVVLDNMESVLPPEPGAATEGAFEPEVLEKILDLAAKLHSVGETRVVFTSRQAMAAPFADNHISIGRLDRHDAIDLVSRELGREGEAPRADDPGESEDEVTRLVDAVGCHARSLVLIAREVAESGVLNATEQLGEIMARLRARHPEDRERSLYASVELSLRRLPGGMRETIRPLGLFHGGGHQMAMALVLGLDVEKLELIQNVVASLEHVGLAEPLVYGYVRLDPALGPLLLSEMSVIEGAEARDRWASAMALVAKALYEQGFGGNPRMVSTLTLYDLANLLDALEHLASTAQPALVADVASNVESLLQYLGRPKALARASRVRISAAARLSEWSSAQVTAARASVDRLLDTGRFREAISAARVMLERAQTASDRPYDGDAAFDLAASYFYLGRCLHRGGEAAAALHALRQAIVGLQALADLGDRGAQVAVSTAIAESGICLAMLGQPDAAGIQFEEAIRRDEESGNARQVAVNKGNLAKVWALQRRYGQALAELDAARRTFEQLGESVSVAATLQTTGDVFQEVGQLEKAEGAYQASLRISMQVPNRVGEASVLSQLGTLYRTMHRPEEALGFFQGAASIFREVNALAQEGQVCNNLAVVLFELGRHEDARREILRAIECKEPFGHEVSRWTSFKILAYLEQAAGRNGAADAARRRAIDAYTAYRRDGGENASIGGRICGLVAKAIADEDIPAAEWQLGQVGGRSDLTVSVKALLAKLRAVLRGARAHSLATDPDLDHDDASELELLLEQLAQVEEV